MNPYYNLPPEQRTIQRFVDHFNADEKLWKKLEPKRRARRKLRPRRSRKRLKKIDLLTLSEYSRDFARGVKSPLTERLAKDYGIDEKDIMLGFGGEDILKQAKAEYAKLQ